MTDAETRKRRFILLAGFIGNVVEWYDFALYGYMVSYLSRLFFPSENHLASMLDTYGAFAAGFIMRPLGSAVFGWLGDVIGRSRTMLISVTMMALPTIILGLLPTYATAGMLAPALLITVRLVQGLSVGGEFSSSVTYLVETAKPDRRGYAGSWANSGSIVGMLIGSAVAAALTTFADQTTIMDWAWRMPFLFGGVIGGFAIFLRQHLPESQHFLENPRTPDEASPLVEAFTNNLGQTLKGMLFASGYGAIFYFVLVYLPNWANDVAGLKLDYAMQVNTGASALELLVIPVFGWMSDRYFRRTPMIIASTALMGLLTWPLFLWVNHSGIPALIVTQCLLAVLLAVLLGACPATFVEMFPVRDRLSCYSVSYNVGLGIFGGVTPMVCTALIEFTGNPMSPAIFVVFMALVSVIGMSLIKDRSREPLQV